ncbi:hypothetical protein NE237_010233 [Protea cynaroides]|uniref:Cyclin-dependent protein kinase inhibitor SMR1 n=1 Tax=Protea cynaroides TaxID=273540 RepID=A0A9Q0R119_9MAGN|nr:hypothetical protein NE237_010233 [Protea cynaroides]
MSTDLELQNSLPEIRLRPAAEEDEQKDTNKKAIQNSLMNHSDGRGDDHEDDGCRTPTSEEHKIPVMRSCPPAPKKQRRVILCKRKRCLSDEFNFFEIMGRHQIESFFSSSFNVKKRCCSNSKSNKKFE